jgi:prevent-host-death family protein
VKTGTTKYPSKTSEPAVLREVATAPGIGPIISVRAAKAHLSALLELVAGGQEITITSDGEPKATLSPVGKREARKVFTGTREHLKKMPPWRGGPMAEQIIREDRDGRGW